MVDPDFDGFRQPTAMFDKGQFLGELAELVDGAPETRAKVEAEAVPPMGCRLIIVAGPDLGTEWGFKAREIIVGRDEDCQLVMSDIAVSRRHARIAFDGAQFVLSDLGSGNGTFLNGVRIQQERLSPGDEIIIGERTLRFVELNEAPATAAAVPVSAGPSPSEIPEPSAFEPVLGPSQVEEVVSAEAAGDELDIPRPQPPASSGRALQALVRGALAVAALVAVVAVGWVGYDRYLSGESPAERARRVRREFLQGVELVKQQRCGDAAILFRRVMLAEPAHPRASAYVTHCETQLEHWADLSAAREMASARRYIEALDRLKAIPADSDYGEQAARDRKVYARSIAYALLEEARDAFDAAQIDKALELVDRALELAPDLEEAHQLRRQVADATAAPKKRRRPRRTFKVPVRLKRSAELYENGKIGSAIDAAEAVGTTEAGVWAERMVKVKRLLAEAARAHRKKAGGELMRISPEALSLDQQVAGGRGKIRARLSKYYADGLYLKGVEALQTNDDVSAYRLLTRAVKVKPDHKLARSRLIDLNNKAQEIYYEGYVLKDQNKKEARRIFRRLTQITSPTNPYHKRAADWLRAHR